MKMRRRVVVEMDAEAFGLLERIRAATIQENVDSIVRDGQFDRHMPANYKAILQRAVASLAREMKLSEDVI